MNTKKLTLLTLFCGLLLASFSFKSAEDQSDALKKSMEAGKNTYNQVCMACHMDKGQGIPNVFPPLAKSDYLMKDVTRNIKNLIEGLQGEITVNGKKYNQVMPASGLDDTDIANVLNYVMNSFGNKAEKMVTKEQVAKVRASLK
ncbi:MULTISPECIES: c-type cytochrome [Roseivirga]|jgi:nitrite reductase (NO-forming)|uniref:c-type cytochrome n=1 Tax=Roseivirga TaxID=290180 RepID=UPI0009FBBDAC|nr:MULTISPECIES: cytochrome c [Roseivirga]MBO6495418.1 cytochrome c [Roseivirga sp.]MBO6661610.1 cytochrome c [Roseivirga sp.]MBO6760489.1 cytochrome c [Roseivirga sp.]MBO6908406.1 cytochrome c [Roseivirga sp.]WPZ11304.1 cytochrome c [Roseivirga spongicola]